MPAKKKVKQVKAKKSAAPEETSFKHKLIPTAEEQHPEKNAPFEQILPEGQVSTYVKYIPYLLIIVGVLLLYNQYQFSLLTSLMGAEVVGGSINAVALTKAFTPSSDINLNGIDLSGITSTAQTLAKVYPLNKIKTQDDAVAMLIPSGTPEYGEKLGVSFDDPIVSLNVLARTVYPEYDKKLRNDPAKWQRYINLASNPYGISCEYCCGIGPIGASKDGKSRCGCQHNPALLGLTMWLIDNTDYSDAEILREVMRWKALFFPKNMVELGMKLSGMSADQIGSLPGMVGGC